MKPLEARKRKKKSRKLKQLWLYSVKKRRKKSASGICESHLAVVGVMAVILTTVHLFTKSLWKLI